MKIGDKLKAWCFTAPALRIAKPFGHIGFAELGLRPSVQLKLNQNPFVLRTPGILEMCPNGAAKPNC